MSEFTEGVGHAVFVRTDVPGYEEVKVAFGSLEEMVSVCTSPKPALMLEKVVVRATEGESVVSLMLGYIASSRGRRVPVETKDAGPGLGT
ncbi:MAG: hypothetical protein ISQ14_12000 [Verrucomicrobiae bacterium]|nr:hypothetical protein [Verrucomicrobiae bacterium]